MSNRSLLQREQLKEHGSDEPLDHHVDDDASVRAALTELVISAGIEADLLCIDTGIP